MTFNIENFRNSYCLVGRWQIKLTDTTIEPTYDVLYYWFLLFFIVC